MKYVIAWRKVAYRKENAPIVWKYYCSDQKFIGSHEITVSNLLAEAHVFDTVEEAENTYAKVDEINPFPRILQIKNKDLFIAKLERK